MFQDKTIPLMSKLIEYSPRGCPFFFCRVLNVPVMTFKSNIEKLNDFSFCIHIFAEALRLAIEVPGVLQCYELDGVKARNGL